MAKLNPITLDIEYGTDIIGDTPRLVFVLSIIPSARITSPAM